VVTPAPASGGGTTATGVTLAFTGANIDGMAAAAATALLLGSALLGFGRRRRTELEDELVG
jgi:hypothetical protein